MINMSKPSTADEIYLDLLNRIINLELEPGQKISENKICELYGVSRSVIRNSFARLMQAGFLEVYPQRGTYVSKIDLDYVRTALLDRKSTRLNSSHANISYAVFCFKKKKK